MVIVLVSSSAGAGVGLLAGVFSGVLAGTPAGGLSFFADSLSSPPPLRATIVTIAMMRSDNTPMSPRQPARNRLRRDLDRCVPSACCGEGAAAAAACGGAEREHRLREWVRSLSRVRDSRNWDRIDLRS